MLPVLFSIGPLHIYSLGICLVLAWCVWSFLFWKKLRSLAVEETRIFDCMFLMTLAALIGSRLFYVIFNAQYFTKSWLLVLTIWVQPGLTLLGGVLSALAVLLLLIRVYKLNYVDVFGAFIAAFLPSYLVGALGSLLDGSVVGKQADKLPWLVHYVGSQGTRHPVQLYAVIAVGLILLANVILRKVLAKKTINPYLYSLISINLFAIAMLVLEFFTERSVYWFQLSVSAWVYALIIGQTLGAFFFVGGVYAAISQRFIRRHPSTS